MKIIFKLINLIIISTLIGCTNNRDSELSNHYQYIDNGLHFRLISSDNILLRKTSIYPDVTDFTFNDKFIIVEQKPDTAGYVTYLSSDLLTRYVAYKELLDSPALENKPEWGGIWNKIKGDSVNFKIFSERHASLKNTSEDGKIRRNIVDSLINNDIYYKKIFSNITNYWIISHSNETLEGPLTQKEYQITRKRMKIPSDLKLKFEK